MSSLARKCALILTAGLLLFTAWRLGAAPAELLRDRETELRLKVAREVARLQEGGAALNSNAALLAAQLKPSVVSIHATGKAAESAGSGVVVRDDGVVLTNLHVVVNMEKIQIEILSGETFEAEIVGIDQGTDLALLRFRCAERLPSIRWADSDNLRVGEPVLAIGNSVGLGWSCSAGIISSLHRKAHHWQYGGYSDYIQTDAAINPGNSGGPLVNANGAVIGINTLLASAASTSIGFALPSQDARFVTEEILANGRVRRGYLGVDAGNLTQLTTDERARMGINTALGVYVMGLLKDGSGLAAGIRVGDIILALDSERVECVENLKSRVARMPVGSTITFTLWRDAREMTLRVVLVEQPRDFKRGQD